MRSHRYASAGGVVIDQDRTLMHLRSLNQIERPIKDLQLVPFWTSWEETLKALSFEKERRWVVLARKDRARGET